MFDFDLTKLAELVVPTICNIAADVVTSECPDYFGTDVGKKMDFMKAIAKDPAPAPQPQMAAQPIIIETHPSKPEPEVVTEKEKQSHQAPNITININVYGEEGVKSLTKAFSNIEVGAF